MRLYLIFCTCVTLRADEILFKCEVTQLFPALRGFHLTKKQKCKDFLPIRHLLLRQNKAEVALAHRMFPFFNCSFNVAPEA